MNRSGALSPPKTSDEEVQLQDSPPSPLKLDTESVKKKKTAPENFQEAERESRFSYDVFLSFRGKDTRDSFTDHLHHALIQKGISTFRDDGIREGGDSLAPDVIKAIEESKFIIVILSSNYASSTECLDQLAKAIDCRKVMGKKVCPVFYKVEPSDVRRLTGNFGKAFSKHTNALGDPERSQKWADALVHVSNLSGWVLEDGDGVEVKVISGITEAIFPELKPISVIKSDGLVAIDYRVEEVISYLDMSTASDKVLMIGIYGMGGIGKTTIAREVFERIQSEFDCCSFLPNVAGTAKEGLFHIHQKLLRDTVGSTANIYNVYQGMALISRFLSSKRVLVIVDDVNDINQLESLCGRDVNQCFGLGSRIIITSRDKHVLEAFGTYKIYKVKALNEDEALQLFSRQCFGKDQVEYEFLPLSKEVLERARGHPVSIQVLGSYLRSKSLTEWPSFLTKLDRVPHKITDILKLCYDELDEMEKQVFLDIACFFKGEDIDRVTRILESCGFDPHVTISSLIERYLVILAGNKLEMHDLIQEMGQIVSEEDSSSRGRRARLWKRTDIMDLLNRNKATSKMEGLFLDFPEQEEVHLLTSNLKFSLMRNLRYFKVHNVKFSGYLEYLPSSLRMLDWHSYPSSSMPKNFQAPLLVELIMHSSHIKRLWKGVKHCPWLRLIDMRDSEFLTETPDFTGVPQLETLVLEGCTSLVSFHPSIGILTRLALLNMRNCISVKRLPPLRLASLQFLIASGCSKMKEFPEIVENMECLLELHLDGTAIVEISQSIIRLTGLRLLNLEDCKYLDSLPSVIRSITSLKTINVTGCSKLTSTPKDLNSLECLEELNTSGTTDRSNLKSPLFLQLKQNFRNLSDRVVPSFWIDPKLFKWNLTEGVSLENGSLTLSRNNNSVSIPVLFIILVIQILKLVFQNYCTSLMVFQNELVESTSGVSATTSCSYPTELVPRIVEIVNLDEDKPGKEAEWVSSGLHSPIESVQDENEIETKNVEENVISEEEKSSTERLERLLLYCSLFPEDFEFRKLELVQLWIAEGLDMKESDQETMEDAGIRHFNTFESQGFLMRSRCDFTVGFDSVFSVPMYSPGNVFYKVNPVELSVLEAKSSGATYFKAMESNLEGASESKTQHLSFTYDDIDDETLGVIPKFKNLRTLLLLCGRGCSIRRIPGGLFLSLNFLTTLKLSRTLISGLPGSIGNVKPLRYLDVSYTPIMRLPESIGSLEKLQTLILRGCMHLCDLPRSTHRLTALRHLDFDIIGQLDFMPAHLGNLTDLQTLSAFLVDQDEGRLISELNKLNDLRGGLRILRLENVLSKADAEAADLPSKKSLMRLDLRWTSLMVENIKLQEEILDSLRPHAGLRELQILFYNGTNLPAWLSCPSFTGLVVMTLYKCDNCELLPSIGQLPELKFLCIVEMNKVSEIDQTFFRSHDDQIFEPFNAFPKLEILEVDTMLHLKEWKEVKEGDLPSLIKLTMESCPELVTLPSFSCLKRLKYLEVKHCHKLVSFDRSGLPSSLDSLTIGDCPELKEWSDMEGDQQFGQL